MFFTGYNRLSFPMGLEKMTMPEQILENNFYNGDLLFFHREPTTLRFQNELLHSEYFHLGGQVVQGLELIDSLSIPSKITNCGLILRNE